MKVKFLKTYHEAGEKAFALVLMLEMLFQKAAGKPVIDRRSAHHTTFKQDCLELPSLKCFSGSLDCLKDKGSLPTPCS